MTRSNDETDKLIREVLEETDAEIPGRLEGQSVAGLLTRTFRGRNRRLALGGAAVNLVIFALGLYSAAQVLRSDDVVTVLRWGLATLFCFGVVTAIKVWYWLEMLRLALTREVKRVELRVAHLAERTAEEGEA